MAEGSKDIKLPVIPEGDDKKKKPDTLKVKPGITIDSGHRVKEEQKDHNNLAKVREEIDDVSDPKIDDDTANFFVEALSQQEAARRYLSSYEQAYVRKDYPSESERIAALQPFVNKDRIEEMKRKALSSGWKAVLPSERKRIKELSEGLLKEDQMLSDTESSNFPADKWNPYIIDTKEVPRMHGGRGMYTYHMDQHGNTFFSPPDGGDRLYAMELAPYFNVNRYYNIMMPLSDRNSYILSMKMRFLAEASKTVDSEKITAEDCDKIDPLPVKDPNRSFIGCAIVNILGGSEDTVVRVSRKDKNYSVRKDGTYYLHDIAGPTSKWNKDFTGQQFDEIGLFLRQIKDPKEHEEMLDYIAKTVVMVSTLDDARGEKGFNTPIFRRFPTRFADEIGRSSVDKADRVGLISRIKDEMQTVIESGVRDSSISAQ